MAKVHITLATAPYPRTEALRNGAVTVEGVDLNYLTMSVEEIFWRMLRHREFDACEMSLSSYVIARAGGNSGMIAIPVFPFRQFRHSAIYVHRQAGIAAPQDLRGKLVGVPEYEITASVWARGILQHEYGVRPEEMRWRSGGEEQPGRQDKSRLRLPAGLEISPIAAGQTLDRMLADGQLDALVAARMPGSYMRGEPQVARLFSNARDVEQAYYQRTGIFPIMHTLVIRQDVYEAHPWLAKSLQKAFAAAKAVAEDGIARGAIEYLLLPWQHAEMEAERGVFGQTDWWPYGLGEMNARTLETFVGYMAEQGLIDHAIDWHSLFAPNCVDEFRV